MRNLRKAALVAVMVGSLGLATAGVASAHGTDDGYGTAKKDGNGDRQCVQAADASASTSGDGLLGLPDVNLALLGNVSETTVIQQVCNNGDDSLVGALSGVETNQTSDGLLELLPL
ncbi:hypothetical protein ACIBBD_26120 [Streptomyces sp. NPDC051315]|uniref:hypothetical protein n=1 Tax=Streptomyces sp. NPDC051315 TaxID=3365650 RepID=UPI0037B93DB0